MQLAPANKFNVSPVDVASVREANALGYEPEWAAYRTPKAVRSGVHRAAELTAYPDDLFLYGVFDNRYKEALKEGFDLGSVVSFYANAGTSFYHEASSVALPTPDAGTQGSYVLAGDKWYLFKAGSVVICDAKTGAVIDTKDTNVGSAARGAGYNPVTNKAYVCNWDGLVEVDMETLQGTVLGSGSGFVMAVAPAKDGLYYVNYAGQLCKFDLTTKENTTVMGNVKAGVAFANQGAALAYDWATGKFYFSVLNTGNKAFIIEIDPAANTATQLIAPEETAFLMAGLAIPYVEEGAPESPTGIAYENGTLSFTAPTKAVVTGTALTGQLTAYVSVDDGEPTQQTVAPGATASQAVSVGSGEHTIYLQVANSVGKSQLRAMKVYVGNDVPNHVDNLKLAVDDGVNAVLTWTAPTTSVGGGPFDESTLNYTIVRYPDEVVVGEGVTATSFTETVPERHARYYYEVISYAGTDKGASALSNVVPAGAVWIPPYTEEFQTPSDFDFFKVVDANGDGQSWKHMWPLQRNDLGYAYCVGNGVTNPETGTVATLDDDYLITPPIKLQAGKDYRLQWDDCDNWLSTESMEVLIGTKQEVTGSETVIMPTATLPGRGEHYSYLFTVPADGIYFIMFHANTVGNSIDISIDNIAVDEYAAKQGPSHVTNLTATAGEKGALTNTISFTAPTTTYDGGQLTSLTVIDVYRNGSLKPCYTFTDVQPGKSYTWTDTDVEQGEYTYRVVPFNENGQGEEAVVSDWVGLDSPVNPGNTKIVMNADKQAVVTFDKVAEKGRHGGYVNPDDVTYVLCRYVENDYSNHWHEVTDWTSALTLTDQRTTLDDGVQQAYINYLLVAKNEAGTSEGYGLGIVIGEPYALPYSESFPNGQCDLDPWTLFADSYYYAWNFVTGSGLPVKPYDKDDGMLQFSYISEDSNTQVLTGPRISLAGVASPEFSFYMYHGFEAEPEDLNLIVYLNYDDEGWKSVATVPYNTGADGWSRYSIPLTAGKGNVQIAFGAHAADASASIYLDAIKIGESTQNDLALENITSDTKRIAEGGTAAILVGVANYGTNESGAYTVRLYDGETEIASQDGDKLAANGTKQFRFVYRPQKADAAQAHKFSAKVDYAADTNLANNTSAERTIYVVGSNLPVALNLVGSKANNTVVLNWQAPATSEVIDPVTDDFEAYEDFIIDDIGDWTTYDGDGTPTLYFNGPQIAHAYEEKAWQVWNPEAAGFSVETFDVLEPKSGAKYLSCWAATDGISQVLPNDDWLISSEVTGGTDVSFFYRMPNAGSDPQVFEMMYSITDKEPESFTAFDRDSIETTTDWVKFEYTLPADAKYFAVRSCSRGSYVVAFLDDITYTPLFGSATPVNFVGYNVYRDGVLLASGLSSLTFTDNALGGADHVYHVTAVYTEGESNFSNAYRSDGPDGIDNAVVRPNALVKGLKNAIEVMCNKGEEIGIYTTAGQQVFKATSAGTTNVGVAPGIYLVKVGNSTYKVIAR